MIPRHRGSVHKGEPVTYGSDLNLSWSVPLSSLNLSLVQVKLWH